MEERDLRGAGERKHQYEIYLYLNYHNNFVYSLKFQNSFPFCLAASVSWYYPGVSDGDDCGDDGGDDGDDGGDGDGDGGGDGDGTLVLGSHPGAMVLPWCRLNC